MSSILWLSEAGYRLQSAAHRVSSDEDILARRERSSHF